MKKLIVLTNLIILIIGIRGAISQPYTPKCTSLASQSLTIPENSQAWIDATNAQAQALYPNATIIDNSSATYNCHGYTWHISNGGARYWINTPGNVAYWNDGSYAQVDVAPSPYATKVSYASDDHSAITTTNPNLFISKWGQWPLMQHAPTYTPYNSTTLLYYAVPIPTGTSLVCTSSTYQTITPSSGFPTYSWTAGSFLSPTSQTGSSNNYNVYQTGNGSSYINVQIASTCSGTTVTARKDIYVGAPVISNMLVNGAPAGTPSFICHGNNYLNVTPLGTTSTAQWTVPSGIAYIVTGNELDFTYPSSLSSLSISANASNQCGTGPNGNFYLVTKSYGCPAGFSITAFPNPTSATLTVQVTDSLSLNIPSNTLNTLDQPYQVFLVDRFSKKVFSTQSSNKTITLSTEGLPSDIYYLTVMYNDTVVQKQVLIKR